VATQAFLHFANAILFWLWAFVFHGIIVATLGSTAYHWGTLIEAEKCWYRKIF
jgi:hypothetical protein